MHEASEVLELGALLCLQFELGVGAKKRIHVMAWCHQFKGCDVMQVFTSLMKSRGLSCAMQRYSPPSFLSFLC